jgi:hypothetical protein
VVKALAIEVLKRAGFIAGQSNLPALNALYQPVNDAR